MREDHQLGNIQAVTKFYAAAKAAPCRRCPGWCPPGEVSEHPPAPVSYGQSYVTSLVNAVMQQSRLGLDGDLPGLGRLGRLLRPRGAPDGGPERLRPAGPGS